MLAKTSHKRNAQIFHNDENAKDRMLEADTNLERSMIIYQDRKVPALYYKLYNEKKTNSAVQTTIDEFFYTENTLIFNIANVLNYDVQ